MTAGNIEDTLFQWARLSKSPEFNNKLDVSDNADNNPYPFRNICIRRTTQFTILQLLY